MIFFINLQHQKLIIHLKLVATVIQLKVMTTTIFILKVSNQNEDGSYDYVKIAGAFFKFEDAMAKAVEKRERMKLEWPNYKQGMHNGCTLWIQSETGIRKWYEVIETVVK
jgi:hypothetical protein